MDIQEKLNSVVKLAQSYIFLFLKEYLKEEQLLNIKNLFANCPITIEELEVKNNEFGKTINIGGNAQEDKIVINLTDIKNVNINNELEINKLLGIIIHEYAHKIRALNNQYGEMLEESFATIFAEICINNARLKLNENQDNKEIFEMLNSVNYQKYESQVRALLYVLKQNNLDQKIIAEYIAGNQEKFKQLCLEIFGPEFINCFNSLNSQNNGNSEQLIIQLLTNYLKQHELNISNYWQNSNKLTQNNLYFQGSPTLAKAIVNCGIASFKKDEQKFYKYYESAVNVAKENENFINQEKVERIKQFIETNFSLKQKTREEIYDTIVDLCSTYIQHQNRENEESKLFIEEIKKVIPDIDDFKTKFITLRVAGKDKNIVANLDLNNITYEDINLSMNKLLQIESDEFGEIKR